ncbi:MAG: bifunctional oligoribonuclease/PAP phosphatase NrnA [Kyrpidia sp.]|nr:bifunctional oligoribonuclease/PAP phosphatase NrnA [Kyrpidia sp.]
MTELEEAYRRAAAFLRENDGFLLLTHVHPDGDALGSVLGMASILQKMGKRVVIAHEEEMPERFAYLPGIDRVVRVSELTGRFAVGISLDCADRRRLGRAAEALMPEARLLNIDHHATNDRFGAENLVDSGASATCQIVCRLAGLLEIPLRGDTAVCLYTGLFTDTGGFRYGNTTADVLRLAAEMIDGGLDPYPIALQAVETVTEKQLRLLSAALAGLRTAAEGRAAYITVTRNLLEETGTTVEDTQELVNYARNLAGVEVGLMFREEGENEVKVSLRSKHRVDVSGIAAQFGGGGHPRAAGCTVEGPLRQVIDRVMGVVAARIGRG